MTKVRIENKVALDRSDVSERLRNIYLASGKVHLDQSASAHRSHLKLHQDSKGGYFVRIGKNGSRKECLGTCKITHLDGIAYLFQFTFKSVDDFNADQDRRWCEARGIEA